MNDEYTPTTDEVRRGFEAPRYRTDPRQEDESFSAYLSRVSIEGMHSRIASERAFGRWLAAHDAEVGAQAKAEGVVLAAERLVLRDQFSERTLKLLDELETEIRPSVGREIPL